MPPEILDNLRSCEGSHMAEIATRANLVREKMRAEGRDIVKMDPNIQSDTSNKSSELFDITDGSDKLFDFIFNLAKSENNRGEGLAVYPITEKTWFEYCLSENRNGKIQILNELMGTFPLNDEITVLYADRIANAGISDASEIDRKGIVNDAEILAAQALDRMNANGYFNRNEQ